MILEEVRTIFNRYRKTSNRISERYRYLIPEVTVNDAYTVSIKEYKAAGNLCGLYFLANCKTGLNVEKFY